MHHLSGLIDRLKQAGVDFVIVGGYAALAHGSSMMTEDVDICCPFTEQNLMKLGDALADVHPVHRLTPAKLPLRITPEFCQGLKNMYLLTDLGVLDCLGEVLGIGNYEKVVSRSIAVDLPGGQCRVLGLRALIEAKEAMGRPHDLQTAKQLRAIEERLRDPGKGEEPA
jgi:hypothetical protein